ncbi:uncharacterized protein LOC102618496 isoform X3 [Citrus sinensis]|uniref:uncharacterized protein LOC102618496 isoform X3 n=1 Tax=Citrus sinensis TaxID=2711 RepID=UPI0022791771|nr:uncharacterized protein LOC102618496 isoform X3 [Citrus sinensis]
MSRLPSSAVSPLGKDCIISSMKAIVIIVSRRFDRKLESTARVWWENNEVQGVEALRKILLPTKYLYFSQIECLLVCLSKPRGGLGNSHPLKKA